MDMNHVTLVGRICQTPEKKIVGEQSLLKLRVAWNRRAKNEHTGEWEDAETGFFDVSAWGFIADDNDTLDIGDKVLVSGRLKQRSWTDDDNNKHSAIEIVANDLGQIRRART